METYCLQLTDHIQDDVALEIIALAGQGNGSAPSSKAIISFGLKTAFRLLRLPKSDVTHLSDMASWPLALIAKMRHQGTRIVLSAHGSDLSFGQGEGFLAKLYKAYMKLGALCLPRAIILANSTWIAALAKAHGFKNVRHIPLASDIQPARQNSKIPGDLFFAGRVMPSKGTSFIVNEVLPRLPEAVHLRIAGTIWDDEGGAITEHPRIRYLGRLDAAALAEEYAAALAVLVPSIAPEGFGLVAAEAAIAGGVVIASDHTGLSEVCSEGVGLLAKPSDAEHWAQKISAVAAWDASRRAAFLAKSQSQAQSRYNWARVAKDTLQAYRP
ncbi:glycosyltransferase family 4 protein [Hellea balneolensis]|uniref:glycosyltransferase family 4 protein n=1 Tax=Hellea balneolensis TaxID=287478 RepID=UPI00138ABD7F|nr:glycosyltransferase family 4 protein [Hellea balneolensis]